MKKQTTNMLKPIVMTIEESFAIQKQIADTNVPIDDAIRLLVQKCEMTIPRARERVMISRGVEEIMNVKTESYIKKNLNIEEGPLFYGHRFYCSNCNRMSHRYIHKGVRAPKSITCDNCGCDT